MLNTLSGTMNTCIGGRGGAPQWLSIRQQCTLPRTHAWLGYPKYLICKALLKIAFHLTYSEAANPMNQSRMHGG